MSHEYQHLVERLRREAELRAHYGDPILEEAANAIDRLATEAEEKSPLVTAYCAANDYINALLNSQVSDESRAKIAADYWAKVKAVK